MGPGSELVQPPLLLPLPRRRGRTPHPDGARLSPKGWQRLLSLTTSRLPGSCPWLRTDMQPRANYLCRSGRQGGINKDRAEPSRLNFLGWKILFPVAPKLPQKLSAFLGNLPSSISQPQGWVGIYVMLLA